MPHQSPRASSVATSTCPTSRQNRPRGRSTPSPHPSRPPRTSAPLFERGGAAAARFAVQEGVAERDDAVHHPDLGTSTIGPQPSADALRELAPEAIQLLVRAQ